MSVTNGVFVIVGNVFHGNGTGAGIAGGIVIAASASATHRLEFNSFSGNLVQAGIGSGVHCIASGFTAKNNIIFNNGTVPNPVQVGGACPHTFSDIGPMGPGALGDASDINADPLFENGTTGDLRVRMLTPVRDKADPNATLTGLAARDIENEARVAPPDIGADQAP